MSIGAILSAILAVVQLINSVIALAQEDEYESLGRAAAIQEAATHVTAMVNQAKAIRAQAATDLSDPATLRDDDGMRRG